MFTKQHIPQEETDLFIQERNLRKKGSFMFYAWIGAVIAIVTSASVLAVIVAAIQTYLFV